MWAHSPLSPTTSSTLAMSKRIRIYTAEDLAEHSTAASCWIARAGKVYDVTNFLQDHPGGDDYILNYAGKDVGAIMEDPVEHEHSDSAYDMLEEFVIGRLGTGESIVSEDWEADDDFHPEETDTSKDFEKNQFLDLRRPLLKQVWEANWSKSYYLMQVHQPRHLTDSAPMFGAPYLEVCRTAERLPAVKITHLQVFTKTAWYVIPTIWLPIAAYLYLRSSAQFTLGNNALPAFYLDPTAPLRLLVKNGLPLSTFAKTGACFLFGNLVWTFLEYTLHRFLFHLDYYLPDHYAALTLHFLLHGIHHYLPMDR